MCGMVSITGSELAKPPDLVGVVQCRCGECGPVQVWWVWSSAGVVGVVQCSGWVCVCVAVQVLSDLREAEEVHKDREGLHQQTLRWAEEERSRLVAAHSNLQQSRDQCRWDCGTGSATPRQCRVCCAVWDGMCRCEVLWSDMHTGHGVLLS